MNRLMGLLALFFSLPLGAQHLGQDPFLRFSFPQNPQYLGESFLQSQWPSYFLPKKYSRFESLSPLGPKTINPRIFSLNLPKAATLGLEYQRSTRAENNLNAQTHLDFEPLSTDIFLHLGLQNRQPDAQHDGWQDLAKSRRLFFGNRWTSEMPEYSSQTQILAASLYEQAGQVGFDAQSALSFYGIVNELSFFNIQSKHQMTLRQDNQVSDLLDVQGNLHSLQLQMQNGNRQLQSYVWSPEIKLRYAHELDSGQHRFYADVQYQFQRIEEQIDSLAIPERSLHAAELSPGYLLYFGKLRFEIQALIQYQNVIGMRAWPHLGLAWTPRFFRLTWTAQGNYSLPNLLSESYFAWQSNRQAQIQGNYVQANETWETELELSKQFSGLGSYRQLQASLRAKLNYQQRAWLIDWEQDAQSLVFDYQGAQPLGLRAQTLWTYRFLSGDCRETNLWASYIFDMQKRHYANKTAQETFRPLHQWALSWQRAGQVRFPFLFGFVRLPWEWELRYVGRAGMRLPLQNQASYPLHRLDFNIGLPLKIEVDYTLKFSFGIDNLLNSYQTNLPSIEQPFSQAFDGAMRWNDFMPRRYYFALRFDWN